MAFAIVHFTVGFVLVLGVLSVISITRYRLTGAYLGGIWALVPDLGKVADGDLGAAFEALHDSPRASAFFLHRTLDEPWFRAHNAELTAVSLAVLGAAFVAYDWRFGAGRSLAWRLLPVDVPDDPP